MILVIDNYDSFVYNLVQYIGEIDDRIEVYRNDAISVDEVLRRKPDRIVISPGPCTPREAGISVDLIKSMLDVPVLGVCLGHQAIGHAFGAVVVRARELMHGKTSPIEHDGKGIFCGIPMPFEATRYHSLVIDPDTMPDCLEVTARTSDGVIMGVRHRDRPIHGVQFHPESILTESGKDLVTNFLNLE